MATVGEPVRLATQVALIVIGGRVHYVQFTKIPYFQDFLANSVFTGQIRQGILPSHPEIPFFEIINYTVTNGFHNIFRVMPEEGFERNMANYRGLFETLDYLRVDIMDKDKLPENRELEYIKQIFIQCTQAWINGLPDRVTATSEASATACRWALVLMYIILMEETAGEKAEQGSKYNKHHDNPAIHVVSHVMLVDSLFPERVQRMLLQAYKYRYGESVMLEIDYANCQHKREARQATNPTNIASEDLAHNASQSSPNNGAPSSSNNDGF